MAGVAARILGGGRIAAVAAVLRPLVGPVPGARRLRAVVRPQDTVARIGGDEFAVMCEGFRSDTEIRSLVSRMEDAIAQPIQIASPRSPSGHEPRRVTASIGIAFASAAEMSAEELIRSADQAMYKIKRRGPEPAR